MPKRATPSICRLGIQTLTHRDLAHSAVLAVRSSLESQLSIPDNRCRAFRNRHLTTATTSVLKPHSRHLWPAINLIMPDGNRFLLTKHRLSRNCIERRHFPLPDRALRTPIFRRWQALNLTVNSDNTADLRLEERHHLSLRSDKLSGGIAAWLCYGPKRQHHHHCARRFLRQCHKHHRPCRP